MRLIIKILAAVAANLIGLLLAAKFIPGVLFTGNVRSLLIVAGALTLLNFLVKPLLKMLFGPLILLTLGLAAILINVLILFALDFFFPNLSIAGIAPLIYTSLIVGVTNFVFHIFVRK